MMMTLKPLLARNRSWAQQCTQRNPEYFQKYQYQQRPHTLWIGCSDSRVPSETLTGAHPGELFVHRNIANMVLEDDDNFMSVLQYALEQLRVKRIIVCGHYGCGGVQAAVTPRTERNSALGRRITHLRHVLDAKLQEYHVSPYDETTRMQRLVEANVVTQFARLIATDPVQNVWNEGLELGVFGCVYDLRSGHLKELIQQTTGNAAL